MREHREPWLKLPEKKPGGGEDQRHDGRFRTHVVTDHDASTAARADAPAHPPSHLQSPSSPVSTPAPTVLPFRLAGVVRQQPVAVERAAEPTLSTPAPAPRSSSAPPRSAPPARRDAGPSLAPATPPPAPKRTGVRKAGAPPLGINDLPTVSSADWVAKVGEAAKMVDVVVVFYTAAYLGSEIFERTFQTVVNEVLPQMSRPYTVYRFSLDAEPDFVAEMAESLGMPGDNPVTATGFAWSGPGRPLLIIGDRALQSRAAFSRFLRQSRNSEQSPSAADSGARRRDVAEFERSRGRAPRSHAKLLGGRVLAILAWCLFGTAALGAAVVGVEPQWARSLLHPSTASGPSVVPTGPPQGSGAPTGAAPPAASLGSPGDQAQAPLDSSTPSRPVHPHARKKRAPRAWGSYQSFGGWPEDQVR